MIKIVAGKNDPTLQFLNSEKLFSLYETLPFETYPKESVLVALASSFEEIKDVEEMFRDLTGKSYYVSNPLSLAN